MTGKIISFGLSEKQLEVVEDALQLAKTMLGKKRDGSALALMAGIFIGDNKNFESLHELLLLIEGATGLRLVAYDPDRDNIVCGGPLLDEIVAGDSGREWWAADYEDEYCDGTCHETDGPGE